MKVIAEATGRTLAQIKTDVANTGDMGIVAQQSKRNQSMLCVPASLTVTDVFEKLREIAKMTGQSVKKHFSYSRNRIQTNAVFTVAGKERRQNPNNISPLQTFGGKIFRAFAVGKIENRIGRTVRSTGTGTSLHSNAPESNRISSNDIDGFQK